MVTISFPLQLSVYPFPDWQKIEGELRGLPGTSTPLQISFGYSEGVKWPNSKPFLIQLVEGLSNNRAQYAIERCIESMCDEEPFGRFEYGTVEDLTAKSPPLGDVILLDGGLRHPNVYEACRQLTGNTRCRTFVVTEPGNVLAEPIAHFSGAAFWAR